MYKQSQDAADILQFGIGYPYGCGCQETPNHCGILQVTPGMTVMFWLMGGNRSNGNVYRIYDYVK